MDEGLWITVDRYLSETLISPDHQMEEALEANACAGLPPIDVAPNQGKLLHLIARVQGAKRILEVGTLGGYSTIWLARALPADGKLITLELDPKHASVAANNINRAGLGSRVEIRVGPALDSLAKLEEENAGPFDLVFLDADKPNNPKYLDWAVRLSRPGTLIIGDNVIRDGAIVEKENSDPRVIGTRAFLEKLGNDPRLDATAIQTVGSKGYDGFALAVVKSPDDLTYVRSSVSKAGRLRPRAERSCGASTSPFTTSSISSSTSATATMVARGSDSFTLSSRTVACATATPS
jgi:predicted O-methyltransferase YrrM